MGTIYTGTIYTGTIYTWRQYTGEFKGNLGKVRIFFFFHGNTKLYICVRGNLYTQIWIKGKKNCLGMSLIFQGSLYRGIFDTYINSYQNIGVMLDCAML